MKKNHRTSAAAIGAALAVVPLAANPAAAQETTQADSTGTPLDDNQQDLQELANQTDDNAQLAETDRFIVTFEDGVEVDDKDDVANQLNDKADEVKEGDVVKDTIANDDNKAVVQVDSLLDSGEQQDVINKLKSDSRVASVEPDYIVKAESSVLSNTDPNASQEDWLDQLGAPKAWSTSTGKEQQIAVLDTGFTDHQDLNSQYVKGYDMLSTTSLDRDGTPGRDSDTSDPGTWGQKASSWHGTHVAGIAAAALNGVGNAGVAPDAKIQPVRVLGINGMTYMSDVVDSITWAAGGYVSGIPDNSSPSTVINASLNWRASQCPAALQTAINFATSRNIPVVVSAGNDAVDASGVAPSNCANVIAVGATNASQTNLSYYSNTGNDVDILTRGDNVYSTINAGSTTPTSGSYGKMSGTSMAAPQIAGVAALLKQVKPDITVDEIRTVLQNTGTTLGRYKVANAEAAVKAVKASTESGSTSISAEDRLAAQQFSDVASNNQFFKEINWLKDQGITTGYSDGTFRPGATVSRGAMAAFFYRMAGSPNFTAPIISPFKDVKTTDPFYKEIS